MSADTAGVQTVTITINGQEVQARAGQTILEACRAVGVEVPTLCYDPRLEPYGACRMCLVEVEGARGPMAACGTAVREGMVIHTHTEKIVKLRKFVLELLLTNHPLDCPVCEAAGDCRLQDYAYEYLVDMVPWGWRGPVTGQPGDHPNIAHFGARCILCGRCVRICREVMSIGCWGYLNRGYDSEVDTPYRLPLQEVGCVSCGQCVSTCPVGAITTQRSPDGARAWQTQKTASTCGYCADGCRVVLHSYKGKVIKVSSDLEKGLNQGNLCVKGRFGFGYASAGDRLTKPLVRKASGKLEEVGWDEALELVAKKLRNVKESKGGHAVGAVCGTHCTNEAAYLLQKLMRQVLGSNNVDAIDHEETQAAEEALSVAFGTARLTGSRSDLAQADVIVVVGANLTESHPVLALTVIKAMRQGKTVIVIDPRRTDLARKAQFHLPVRPGTDALLLRAFARHLLDQGLADMEFVKARTDGYEEFLASLDGVDVAAEAAACGVDAKRLREAATAFGKADRAAVLFGSGVTHGPQAASVVAALADLVMLTGQVGRSGASLYPLRSGANSLGVADMGMRPDVQAPAGLGLSGMISALRSGELVALYVVGCDPVLAVREGAAVREALAQADFVVVEDSFLTETAQYADVVLPAAVTAEEEGTFTNGEGVVQKVRPAVAPAGESLPDWLIVTKVANALGAGWSYGGPAEVTKEIAQAVALYAGVSRAEEEGVVSVPGRPADKCVFAPITDAAVPPVTDDQYPYVLLTGSVREHHGTGERTRRASGLTKLVPEAWLEVSPADGKKLGLTSGDRVRVVSRSGAVEVEVRLAERMPEGMVFLPGFSPSVPVNVLWGDGRAGAPAVRLERLG